MAQLPQALDCSPPAGGFGTGHVTAGGIDLLTMDEALVVDSVVKEFGDTKAVNQMTFSAKAGEVLALLGPNGAGKSTTLDMCTGFTSPTSGSIRVLGLDPAKQPQKVRERIGIMLQGGGSYSGLGVQEMLELTASYHLNPVSYTHLTLPTNREV